MASRCLLTGMHFSLPHRTISMAKQLHLCCPMDPLVVRAGGVAVSNFCTSPLFTSTHPRFSHLQLAAASSHNITHLLAHAETSSFAVHAGHDALCSLAVFLASVAWFRLFEMLVERKILEQKLSRKLIHISTGIIYASLWPIFSTSVWSRYFALAVPSANVLKLLLYGLGIINDKGMVNSMSRNGCSRELLGGPLCYVLVLVICTIFFWRDSPVGIVVLSIMCGGDGIADIVGRRLGSIKLPYNSSKSWAGSISMFVCSVVLSLSFLYYYSSLGFYDLDWVSTVKTVALISLAATLVESLPISLHLNDNMSVPLVSALLGSVLFPAIIL